MAITQKDIALHLEISAQQVGFALRGDGRVAPATRQRVLDAARELGYLAHANTEARVMASKRHGGRGLSGMLGVACLNSERYGVASPFASTLLRGIQDASEAADYEVLNLNLRPSAGWTRVDGIIGMGERLYLWGKFVPPEVPIVSLFSVQEGLSSVNSDDYGGARLATEHLLSLGHRRIGYVVYPVTITERRVDGYRDALRAAGIEPDPSWQALLWNTGAFESRGRLSMANWLDNGFRETGVTALLAQNDRAAIGMIQTLTAAGYRVPQDISVVGFDSTDECELSAPRLTSVRVPLQEAGAKAFEILQRTFHQNGPQEISETILPTTLDIRDSTAPPR